VKLPSGVEIWAVSFEEDDPYSREAAPDFGLYLDEKWAPPWHYKYLPWPDFGLPTDRVVLQERLAEVLARAKGGDRVEIGCWGAHGRTGTALGCLAILDGSAPEDAVGWVRA
jgi:protein-tyrosine phosphatase